MKTDPKGINEMASDVKTGWQPIETAPIETRVLLWCEDNRNRPNANAVVFGRIVDFLHGERKAYGEGMTGAWLFTHWMPLPDPPQQHR